MLIPSKIYKNYFRPYEIGDMGSIRERLKVDSKELLTHDEYGHTPAHYASYYGKVKVLEELYEAGYIFGKEDKQNKFERSSLVYATIMGNEQAIKFLVYKSVGRYVDYDKHGNYACMYSLNLHNSPPISLLLLQRFINKFYKLVNNNGVTILHLLVKLNNVHFLKFLLDCPSGVTLFNCTTKNKFNVVSIALLYQSYDCLKFLLENYLEQLDFTQRDNTGKDMFLYLDVKSTVLMNQYSVNIFMNSNIIKHFKKDQAMMDVIKLNPFYNEERK